MWGPKEHGRFFLFLKGERRAGGVISKRLKMQDNTGYGVSIVSTHEICFVICKLSWALPVFFVSDDTLIVISVVDPFLIRAYVCML